MPAAALLAVAFAVLTAATDPRATHTPWLLFGWGLLVWRLLPSGPGLVVAAAAVRLPLLFAPLAYSDDVYRYVWEGRVWLAGESPFALPPDAPELVPLRNDDWALVNHRQVSSIYPPLAQALFVLLAGGGTTAWRVAMAACDVATAWRLGRRDPRAGWAWALLPLPALESAASGHLEGVGVLLLVLALEGRPWAAWAGGMVKLLPAVLLRDVRWLVPTALLTLPLLLGEGALRGFETYRQTWAYNGSLYALAGLVLDDPRPWLQGLGATIAVAAWWRWREPRRIALCVLGAFVALSPTVHPWYVLWPLAPALLLGVEAWTWLAVAIPLSYAVLASYDPATSSWAEPAWPRWVVYPLFYAWLAREGWRRLTRAGPWPVG